ncbi:MAG: hypothetical protein JSV22_13270 [Bacteroidales bacterium]|nr:MAG: hypothetical protein JSV22_13270 [Bacteroidales bacterium]
MQPQIKTLLSSLKVLTVVFFFISATSSCKKEEERIMAVTNDSISDISSTSAKAHATIVDIGNGIEQHGQCWSTSTEPTLDDNENMTEEGSVNAAGSFTSTMVNLMPDTKYYTRAYVRNSDMVVYGNALSFTTLTISLPVVTTGSITDLTTSNATISGNLNSLGEGASSVTQHGHCWASETATPTIDVNYRSSLGSRNSTGSFQSLLVGLSPNVTYYVRAYATNNAGTAYGDAVSFTTPQEPGLPVLTTTAAGSITETTALSGGNITDDGGSTITARGVCWSTSENPTLSDSFTNDGSGTGDFASNITGLSPGTKYYVRAYATNSTGTAYGSAVSFTTPQEPGLPVLTTTSAGSITETTALSGGNITDDGGSTVTARGVCWSTSENPTISNSFTTDGSGTGSFTSNISGLSPGTKYYVRAYATNSVGTSYGEPISFVTEWGNTKISDFDGNSYSTVQIGSQIWMAENLKTTHYSNGASLVDGTGLADISGDYTTKYCFVYADNSANKNTYGLLYTWAAAVNGTSGSNAVPSGIQGVCPAGWHLPSDEEWKELEIYLGMSESEADNEDWRGTDQGGKLKESGTTHWNSPNEGATNASGFTAIAAGHRTNADTYTNMNTGACFWSTTSADSQAWTRLLLYNNAAVRRTDYFKNFAFSVRCVKD